MEMGGNNRLESSIVARRHIEPFLQGLAPYWDLALFSSLNPALGSLFRFALVAQWNWPRKGEITVL